MNTPQQKRAIFERFGRLKWLGIVPGDDLEFVEEKGEFRIRNKVQGSPFDKYTGYLNEKDAQDPDRIGRDLRRHDDP